MHGVLKSFQKKVKINPRLDTKSLSILILTIITLNLLVSYKIHLNSGSYFCNKGIAFGLIMPKQLWLIWFLVLLGLIYFLFNNYQKNKGNLFIFLYTGIFFSGIVSNLLDRLIHSCIIDYFSILSLPLFNLPDIEIFSGLLLIIFVFIVNKDK